MTSNAEQTPTPPEFVKCPDCRNGFTDGGYSCPTCTGTGEVPAPPAEQGERRGQMTEERRKELLAELAELSVQPNSINRGEDLGCPWCARPFSNPADDAELVERVARILYDRCSGHSASFDDRGSDSVRNYWRAEARTALQTEQAES